MKARATESGMGDKPYDLGERTALFGERIITFVKTLPHDRANDELVRQIVRAGTSVGANWMEADGALTKKDFRYKVATCKKEAKETIHWLRMIACANPNRVAEGKELGNEALELARIFSAILRKEK